MQVSLQWLRELVACDMAADVLAEKLSIAGFEVEEIVDLAARAAGVVVGYVEQREPHPDANKLSVCTVAICADEPLQIVCGAKNVRAGIHVAVATVGAYLPAVDLKIKPAELRGVASSGMICSLSELGLADSSDGIVILDDALDTLPPVGSPVGPLFGLDDQVLELAITANRPDGLSMLGIAREVAALTGASLSLPAAAAPVAASPLPVGIDVQDRIEDGGLFSLTALSGVQVGPSPRWLQSRLERAGLRPINNVVDITNLVMLEQGQPLHAFDADRLARLSENQLDPAAIDLRAARPAEAFTTLDGTEHSLSEDAWVVSYADHAIALAGVMGGQTTAVDGDTTSIWLEAAMFAPQTVRKSARSLGLRTDASSRFEKGLPVEVTLGAADRAVALLQELCGATVQSRWLHQRSEVSKEPLELRRDALHNLLGPVTTEGAEEDLADAEIERILQALGCSLEQAEEGWLVHVPPARAMDLQREVDLIEEVARLVGYDRFASHLPDPIAPGGLTPVQEAERRLRRLLAAAGLQEVCSLSLGPAEAERTGADPSRRVPLANPLLADYSHLRDSLVDELLFAAQRNLKAGRSGFWAFEIGNVFDTTAKGSPQSQHLAGLICGSRQAELWSQSGKPQALDYFSARGLLQSALAGLKLPVEDRRLSEHPLLHPGRAAQIVVEGRPAGFFGQVHPELAEQYDLPPATYLFQLEVTPLLSAATRRNRWQPSFATFATVPASERDLALVVNAETASAQLLNAIRKAGKPLLEQAELVDRYEGEQLAAGSCSQAFRLRYRDPKRTLKDSEVDEAHAKIRAALEKQFGAQLRA
ncbi:phenylalanine--tRNA ligase subunit beta [Synechococcus sp. LTW-R]|uniref:phenylalanine--tRNA ligase subunit beta n=1 Tax=Synechococcus sp. LTW-R TaxID=2751170 RepID=UPI0016256F15|nr:phenylalanine--tRNA ligase subunit beta [Synechococcus sp. LTW-R]QNG30208.1 phenylalanine--tRNA ligase subunit beta [Synechococcus sp. LTW-R]